MVTDPQWPIWASKDSRQSREILLRAYRKNRPIIFLLGAGMSADSGIPLASQLSQYLVQVWAMIKKQGFSSTRQYIEEMGWPSRHDLRIELMLECRTSKLNAALRDEERRVSQASLVNELRRASPTLAYSLDEVFGQMREQWNKDELIREFGELKSLASGLAKRVPRNVAYRSLLFHLCENSQALIDGCLDHFIRDRDPTTTHQFIVFFSKLFRSQVILSTNFDSLLERAFAVEGIVPRVYEIQGEGSLPSARMLLAQQHSIVKLHGGAHQMRTGFDLDEPLTPTVLASFYELFDRLEERSSEPPLLLVLGYSGSDRRVMDIVGTAIKRWKPDDDGTVTDPCVLWVAHDPWVPELLHSAVSTHPQVLYRNSRNTGVKVPHSHPAHLIHYQEGRLFLLEHYQEIAKEFPISQLNYQAVNFVPHARAREENQNAARLLSAPDGQWSVALIAADVGGGSSSQLAKLASDLDTQFRSIWIDLAEVPSVAALVDVLAERLAKYDHRLQSPKRPQLMQNTLYGECKEILDERGEFINPALNRTESWELEAIVRWFAHAVRRGEYLILFDSMDEFPGRHPAMPDDDEIQRVVTKERSLLIQFFHAILQRSADLGDSKIAIATSYISRAQQSILREDSRLRSYEEFQEFMRREAGAKPNSFQFVHLPGIGTHDLASKNDTLKDAIAKFQFFNSDELNCGHLTSTINKLVGASKTRLKPEDVTSLMLTVASCCRRIRSEQLLTKVAGRIVEALMGITDGSERPASSKLRFSDIFEASDKFGDKHRKLFANLLWTASIQHSPRSRGSRLNPETEEMVQKVVHFISGTLDGNLGAIPTDPKASAHNYPFSDHRTSNNTSSEKDLSDSASSLHAPPRWFYRLEGAYHWMHQRFRNELYLMLQKRSPLLVALTHHRIAEFCLDDLYSRSKDARAFLEYIFHRTAAIRMLAITLGTQDLQLHTSVDGQMVDINNELLVEWTERISLAIQKEHDVLLARARVPALVAQLRTMLRIIAIEVFPKLHQSRELVERLLLATCRLLSMLADMLLAAGHPHSALQFQIVRARLLVSEHDTLGVVFGAIYKPGCEQYSLEMLNDEHVVAKLRKIVDGMKNESAVKYARYYLTPVELESVSTWTDLLHAMSDAYVGNLSDPTPAAADIPIIGRSSRRTRNLQEWPKEVWYAQCHSSDEAPDKLQREALRLIASSDGHDVPRLLSEFRHVIFQALRHRDPIPAELSDLSRRVFKRELELVLLRCLPNPLLTIGLYDPSVDTPWVIARFSADEQALFRTHVWRSTTASSRHECYRLCLLARSIAAASTPDRWDSIWPLFLDAEAVLDRQGGPADLQALAITRVTHAEHLLTCAEYLNLEVNRKIREQAFSKNVDNEKLLSKSQADTTRADQYHQRAQQLLTSADPLMAEGRGENRWRYYYALTKARYFLFRAKETVDDLPVKALEDFTWAGRFLVGAASNCGRWTDRRIVIKNWWQAYERCIESSYKESGEELMRRMRSRLGVDWNINWSNPLAKFKSNQTH